MRDGRQAGDLPLDGERAMSSYSRATDANHTAVKGHLQRIGYEVLDLSRFGTYPDLLVKKAGGDSVFVEVKIPGSRARWQGRQLRFIASTRFNVIVAYSGDDAALKLRERRYLTQPQKNALAGLLAFEPRDYYQPSRIDELLSK
jgi:hypothetical protein